MIWAKFRLSDGTPIGVMSPMAQAGSFTIVKGGVIFWRPNGDLLIHYKNDQIAEVHDNYEKYYQEPVKTNEKIQYYIWRHGDKRNAAGMLVP